MTSPVSLVNPRLSTTTTKASNWNGLLPPVMVDDQSLTTSLKLKTSLPLTGRKLPRQKMQTVLELWKVFRRRWSISLEYEVLTKPVLVHLVNLRIIICVNTRT
uniref:Uncharacterized protein n=1 Tax=Cacopsylla melanoneura TaxID=428564 RepID=A0A8D9F6A6_9HEMI